MINALKGWFINNLTLLSILGIFTSVIITGAILKIYAKISNQDLLLAVTYLMYLIFDLQMFLEEFSHLETKLVNFERCESF